LDWCQVVATPAFHSSDTACALGHIVRAADGTTIYHAGDTSIYKDMELWGRLYPLDLAFLPIGGIFTMDAFQASKAVGLLKPRIAVPIHYHSFPIVAQSADDFIRLTRQEAPEVRVAGLTSGEALELA